MNELPQPQPATQQAKQLFYNICLAYEFDDETLQKLADMAKVHKSVVDAMFVSFSVHRAEAEKVLVAFSEYTHQAWSLNNVRVALMPTFADLHAKHSFDLATLSTGAGVPAHLIDMMLEAHPVPQQDAMLILQMASRLTGEISTLDTIDVPIEKEVQHE